MMNEWICLSMIWMREPLTLLLACLGYDATRYRLAMSLTRLDSEMRGWTARVYE